MKQMKLFNMPTSTAFGGELLLGKRKSKRPLSTKHAINVVLRGDISKCRSLRKKFRLVESIINKWAQRFAIKIYKFSINSNHIHLLIKLPSLKSFGQFTRALCGELALKIDIQWLWRPFTRVVAWGKAFIAAKNYVVQNILEASGQISYTPRGQRRRKREVDRNTT